MPGLTRTVNVLILLLLLVAIPPTSVAATDPPASAPADPVAESRLINEEISKLTDATPIARQAEQLTAKMNQIDSRNAKDRADLANEYQKLVSTPAWKEYAAKVEKLRSQLADKWEIERKAVGDAARRIYTARHEELRKLALPAVAEGRKLGFDVLSYPRVDGSTSTHPLSVIVASRLLGVPYQWLYPDPKGAYWGNNRPSLPEGWYLEGVGWPLDRGYRGEADYEFDLAASRTVAKIPETAGTREQRVAMMINSLLAVSTSTHDAYVNTIEGKCDLNLSARGPSASELKLAKDKGVTFAVKPIAKDALVFIVNQKNPVKTLTLKQVRQVYEDKITDWKDLGGTPGEILPLRRERDSGSRELFDAMVVSLADPKPDQPGRRRWAEMFANSMSGPYNRVTKEPATLGYSVYYYEHFMAMSPATRTIAIDGVEPTFETIASGRYPLICPVYAAYREGLPAESPTMRLVTWLLSAEGQAVVRESGYVPAK